MPLVSCIMPTADRRRWVPDAIDCFLRQDYANRELIILDDGTDPVAGLMPTDDRLRYVRLRDRLVLGAKRNLACSLARGEWVAHWDDDDWYPHNRLSRQLSVSREGPFEVIGSSRLIVHDTGRDAHWRYACRSAARPWVAGTTLLYRRATWERRPFAEMAKGEDTHFVWSRTPGQVLDLADETLCLVRLHDGNTSAPRPGGEGWSRTSKDEAGTGTIRDHRS